MPWYIFLKSINPSICLASSCYLSLSFSIISWLNDQLVSIARVGCYLLVPIIVL